MNLSVGVKKNFVLHIIGTLICSSVAAQTLPSREVIVSTMRSVGDYQMVQPWPEELIKRNPYASGPKSWVGGAYYPGIVALYKVTEDQKYLSYLLEVGKGNNWEQGGRLRSADDQAIIQTYLDLYEIVKDPVMLVAAKSMADQTMKAPNTGSREWSWSDALFMAPPIWPHLAAITKNIAYVDFMDKMWWNSVDSLYSDKHHLLYRDRRFKTMQSKHGKPIFWSRGNGWVAGGLVRVLSYMPADYPSRPRYEHMMREMAGILKEIQMPDGFWKASLLDPEEFPHGETSGTALFCYMFAWGINNGILDKATYMPTTVKAWNALMSAVHSSGKLGYAQGGNDRPYICRIDHGEPFAVGGFLMAGSEILKLMEKIETSAK